MTKLVVPMTGRLLNSVTTLRHTRVIITSPKIPRSMSNITQQSFKLKRLPMSGKTRFGTLIFQTQKNSCLAKHLLSKETCKKQRNAHMARSSWPRQCSLLWWEIIHLSSSWESSKWQDLVRSSLCHENIKCFWQSKTRIGNGVSLDLRDWKNSCSCHRSHSKCNLLYKIPWVKLTIGIL